MTIQGLGLTLDNGLIEREECLYRWS